MTYNHNFDNEGCYYEDIFNRKACDINTSIGVELWIEDIIQLANRQRVKKTKILLIQMLLQLLSRIVTMTMMNKRC